MTAERLAAALDEVLKCAVEHEAPAYDLVQLPYAVREMCEDALAAYRSAPPVDVEACAKAASRAYHGEAENFEPSPVTLEWWVAATRAVLREIGVKP